MEGGYPPKRGVPHQKAGRREQKNFERGFLVFGGTSKKQGSQAQKFLDAGFFVFTHGINKEDVHR